MYIYRAIASEKMQQNATILKCHKIVTFVNYFDSIREKLTFYEAEGIDWKCMFILIS
jgi:hypothetical protein